MDGLRAADYLAALPGSETSGAGQGGEFEGEIAFYLPGPVGDGFDTRHRGNRATHFAGGSLKCPLPKANETLSVELWFWNGMPYEVRDVAGDLLTLSAENESATQELIVLSLAGRGEQAGKLRLAVVGDKPLAPGEERHASFRTVARLAWHVS